MTAWIDVQYLSVLVLDIEMGENSVLWGVKSGFLFKHLQRSTSVEYATNHQTGRLTDVAANTDPMSGLVTVYLRDHNAVAYEILYGKSYTYCGSLIF